MLDCIDGWVMDDGRKKVVRRQNASYIDLCKR